MESFIIVHTDPQRQPEGIEANNRNDLLRVAAETFGNLVFVQAITDLEGNVVWSNNTWQGPLSKRGKHAY